MNDGFFGEDELTDEERQELERASDELLMEGQKLLESDSLARDYDDWSSLFSRYQDGMIICHKAGLDLVRDRLWGMKEALVSRKRWSDY